MAEIFRQLINISGSLTDGASKAPPSASCKTLGVNLLQMLTSKDLLYKALEYDTFWYSSSKRVKNTASSKARKLQLDSLLLAFDISKKHVKSASKLPYHSETGTYSESIYSVTGRKNSMNRYEYIKHLDNFRYFTTGEFIADKDWTVYKQILKNIGKDLSQIYLNKEEKFRNQQINLVQLFSKLYLYRQSIHFTLNIDFITTVEANQSIEDYYSSYLKKSVAEKVNNSTLAIDKILCLLIDPQKREFTEKQVGYVDYDFNRLDKESLQSFNE